MTAPQCRQIHLSLSPWWSSHRASAPSLRLHSKRILELHCVPARSQLSHLQSNTEREEPWRGREPFETEPIRKLGRMTKSEQRVLKLRSCYGPSAFDPLFEAIVRTLKSIIPRAQLKRINDID